MKLSKNAGTTSNKKYVVTRNGIRVSESEYDSITEANAEFSHWKGIIKKWPDRSVIEVEEYNEKKHKVY